MRYSTTKAINLETHIARNRELIQTLPGRPANYRTWCPEICAYVYNSAIPATGY